MNVVWLKIQLWCVNIVILFYWFVPLVWFSVPYAILAGCSWMYNALDPLAHFLSRPMKILYNRQFYLNRTLWDMEVEK